MIKCIACDLDGTLYDEESYADACYQAIADFIKPETSEEIVQIMKKIRREEGDSRVFQRLAECIDMPESMISELVNIYQTYPAHISLYPDAELFLKSSISARLALLTNGSVKTQSNKCKLLKLDQYFEKIFITGMLPRNHWKPAPEAFLWMCDEMKVKPCECLYLGDNYENDYLGAINCGLNACLVDRKNKFDIKDCFLIRDFNDLDLKTY